MHDDPAAAAFADRQARLILANAVDYAIVGVDRVGIITSWNVGAVRIMGWSAEQAIGRHVDLFFTPEDVEAGISQAEMRAAVRYGRGVDERWHIRHDGERFWANGEMMPLLAETGELEGYVKILRDRTEQHMVRTVLTETEQRYRSLYDALDEGFCLIEVRCDDAAKPIDYRFLEVNPAFERQTGLVDAPGNWMRDLAPDHEQYWFEIFAKVALTGESVRFELPAQALNSRWYEVFAYRVGEPADRLVAILFSDITERRAGEARLRASEDHLRAVNLSLRTSENDLRRADRLRVALTELSDRIRDERDPGAISRISGEIVGATLGANLVGYGVVDAEAETISVDDDWTSEGAASLMGVARFRDYGVYIDDLKAGRTVIIKDAFTDPRTRDFADALKERSAIAFVNTPIQERGAFVALLYVSQSEAREWNEEELGFIREVAARVRSAAERARSDRALREINERLEAEVEQRTRERDRLWQTTTDLMGTASYEGYLIAVNPAWTQLLGWSEAELLARPFFDFIDPADHEATTRVVARLKEGESVRDFSDHVTDRDGNHHVVTWTAVPDDRTGLFNIVGRDVTEQRRIEEALHQSQKMEAIGQLTGGVAHDFNNLLTVIRGSVDLLRRDNVAAEKRQRYLDAIGDTADRAAKLTGQLLAFARRQTLEPEVFDVGQRLDAVSDMLDSITGTRVLVRFEVPDTACRIRADVSQFETALVNLAVNARDAMDGEGTIVIRLQCNARMPAIRGHGPGTGDFVAVSVSDTGIGIAPGDLDRIFEPFFTTKETGKGTGLGLSQVFGFAKQSGGDVGVESVPGRGSTFCLYLPQADADSVKEVRSPGAQGTVDGEGLCVLVVEDNISVGQFATQLLEDLGYRTEWVTSAEEALERLGSDGDGFDIVFSDVMMPGIGGIELARRLARDLPAVPVVLASGYSHVLAQEGAEGMELLRKPYSANQLSAALQRRIAWAADQAG